MKDDKGIFSLCREPETWPRVLFAMRDPVAEDSNSMYAQWWYNAKDKRMWIWDVKWVKH